MQGHNAGCGLQHEASGTRFPDVAARRGGGLRPGQSIRHRSRPADLLFKLILAPYEGLMALKERLANL